MESSFPVDAVMILGEKKKTVQGLAGIRLVSYLEQQLNFGEVDVKIQGREP